MIEALDHFTIVASDLERSRGFYVEVLGLREGERPAFDFPGAWLYCGRKPIVHLVAGRETAGTGTGALDHVAFRATGLCATVARLRERDIGYRLRTIPGLGLRQVFVHDPDGVQVELNFAADEPLPPDA